MNNKLDFKLLIWLLFIVFLIHNLEEFLYVSSWIKENINLIPSFVSSKIENIILLYNFNIFVGIALSLASILPLIICIWINKTKKQQLIIFLLLIIVWIMFLNALQHLFNSLIMKGYTPGLVSAILINLPFSIYFIIRLIKEKTISKKHVFLFLPIGLISYILCVATILLISYNILIFIKP